VKRKRLIIKSLIVTILALILIKFLNDQRYIQIVLSPKYLVYLIVTVTAITLLGMRKVSNVARIITLIILFAIFGIFIGIHPSPLCALTKSFTRYQMRGFIPPPMIVMAGAMILFTIIGNKIFCGWICPLGCLQEVIFRLSKIIRKVIFPFIITNFVRLFLVATFFIIVFSFQFNIYSLFNPFEFFHWDFQGYTFVIMSIVILASLFYYRPFCQLLCPAGLITWFFEHVSIFRIQQDKEKCNSCNKCIKESPCNAIESIIYNHKIIPDCFACGKCIESCPERALSFHLW
jgi:polyferredoxin